MSDRLFVRLDEDETHGPEAAPPAGSLQSLPVAASLSRYVAHVLLYRESIAPGTEVVERVIPDGALRLVVNLGNPPAAGSAHPVSLIGPSASPVMVRLTGSVHGLSVTLRAGAALALFGVPAAELNDAQVPLDAFWGRRASALHDRLRQAPDDFTRGAELQAILQRAVRHRPGEASARDCTAALHRLAAGATDDSLRHLARTLGVGERRLQQLFRRDVGLSPRTWRRLSRVHRCIRALRARNHVRWADLAAAHGFYDQPHLNREFQALCGCTPAEFLRQSISHPSKTADR